ncbi:MAG: GtrA family protein [Actinomycetota bacterium]|nr:GtrA family protein [Actinomycetota bacterium]
MAAISTKLSSLGWRVLPGPVRRKLQSAAGRQFLRFLPVSLAALAASQVALLVLLGIIGLTAGTAGFIASMAGAAVSYVLSRWAWGRKGRPDLLRETLPFWIVSAAAWTFLSFASHEASVWSRSMGHSHWERVAVVAVVYFLANCLTFAARFVIFHNILFARPKGASARRPGQEELSEPLELAGERRAEPPRR